MATKKTDTTTALATREANTAMAVADQAQRGDTRGTEGIDGDDVRLPFLAIAQKTSGAIDDTSDERIEGLKFGQMYNSETREVYGDGPIEFIPLAMRKRAHLTLPNGKNGEQIDWHDPRCTWEDAQARGLQKPEAKRIYDWVVLIVPTMEMAVISFYGKSFGTGKSLNSFVRVRRPSFAGKYALSVGIGENESGKFGKFTVKPAGKPTPEEFEYAEQAFTSIQGATIVTTSEPVEEPPVHDDPDM